MFFFFHRYSPTLYTCLLIYFSSSNYFLSLPSFSFRSTLPSSFFFLLLAPTWPVTPAQDSERGRTGEWHILTRHLPKACPLGTSGILRICQVIDHPLRISSVILIFIILLTSFYLSFLYLRYCLRFFFSLSSFLFSFLLLFVLFSLFFPLCILLPTSSKPKTVLFLYFSLLFLMKGFRNRLQIGPHM